MGTDHGVAAPVMFFGAALNPGMVGLSPEIPAAPTVTSQVPMQYDFRRLYSTIMQDWMCMTPGEAQSVLGSNFVKLPIFVSSSGPLPLEDITLTGQYYAGESRLTYKVEDNTHYEKFSIEFSTDGLTFNPLYSMNRVSLNGVETYSYTHTSNAPRLFYRIRGQLLQNGRIKYSNTVMLRSNARQQLISVFPNPVENNQVYVRFLEKPDSWVDITIYDLLGAKVYYNRFTNVSGQISFRVPPSFSRETHYILEAQYGDTVAREQLIFR
jgi:hypothetical protein